MTTRYRQRVSPRHQAEKWCSAKKDPDGFEVKFVSESIGHGLFASQNFAVGDFLLEYRGVLKKRVHVDDAEEENDYLFHFHHKGVTYSIDASDPGAGLGRWANDEHKAPNASIKKIIVNDVTPHLCLFACNTINRGDEIRYDYGVKDLPWRQPLKAADSTSRSSGATLIDGLEVEESEHSEPVEPADSASKSPGVVHVDGCEVKEPEPGDKRMPVEPADSTSKSPGVVHVDGCEVKEPEPGDKPMPVEPADSTSKSPGFVHVDGCKVKEPEPGDKPMPVEPADSASKSPGVVHVDGCKVKEPEPGDKPKPVEPADSTSNSPGVVYVDECEVEDPDLSDEPVEPADSTSKSPGVVHVDECEVEDPDLSDEPVEPADSTSKSPGVVYVDECEVEEPDLSDEMLELSAPTDDSDSDYLPDSESTLESGDEKERSPSPVIPLPGFSEIHHGRLPTHVNGASVSENQIDSTSTSCNESSGIQVNPTANGRNKSWNKGQYCPFCMVPQKKLPRHLQTPKHRDEPQVQKWLATEDKKDKERQLALMRNYGNYLHNISVLKKGVGELIVVYRPAGKSNPEDYVPCPTCYGFITKTELWKHKCSQIVDDDSLAKKKNRGKVRAAKMLLPITPGVNARTREILSSMINDNVASVVRSDDLITKFAERLTMKHGHSRDQENYVRQRARELGRMVIEYRRMTGETHADLSSLLCPEKFEAVIDATKQAAGFDAKRNVYKTPSLALKIGHGLKTSCEILQGKAIMMQNSPMRKSCKAFLSLYDLQWEAHVTHHALRTLEEGRRNNPKILPLTEDVVKFAKHLKVEVEAKMNQLEESSGNNISHEWHALSEVLLANIVVFNRKRPGEVSKMTMSDYRNCSQGEGGLIDDALSKFEKKLCHILWRVEIVGKCGRTVPVLLTSTMKRAMDLLKEKRSEAGIEERNTYVFAVSGEGHLRACDAIRLHSTKCGAHHPEHLRATRLRKQIATVAQIMNLKENELDVVANFLGHDIRTHREYYRLPDSAVQLAKVSKVLLKMEKGDLASLANRGLDEVQLDSDEEYITDAKSDSEDEAVKSNNSPSVTVRREDCSAYSGKSTGTSEKQYKRKVWTLKEKTAVAEHLGSFLRRRTLPGKACILKLFDAEPQTFRGRTWTHVKDFVRNQIRKKDVMGFLKV